MIFSSQWLMFRKMLPLERIIPMNASFNSEYFALKWISTQGCVLG
jgi:hypothetical protein